VSLSWFKQAGYLPEAMINFLGTMAHTIEKDGKIVELFTMQQFIDGFKVERLVLGGPVFDLKKLVDLNATYLHKQRSDAQRVQYLKNQLFSDEHLEAVVKACGDRWKKSDDFIDYAPYFFTGSISFDLKEAVLKGRTGAESSELFAELVERVDAQVVWNVDTAKTLVEGFASEKNLGKELLGPLRWVVTGKKATPGIFDILAVLGREQVRTRIRAVLEGLKQMRPADA
jgi:glutamyl-tRNA synthetase